MALIEVGVLRSSLKEREGKLKERELELEGLRVAIQRVKKAQSEWDYEKNPYPRQCVCLDHRFENEVDASMEDLVRLVDPSWSV